MTVVGFDFGTTNSLISVITGKRPINMLDRDGLPIPSVVGYEGTRTFVGREARDRLDTAGIGVHDNIVRSPKFLLDRETVHVGGVERSPVDVVHDVVAYVKQEALQSYVNVDLGGVEKAVVTIPVTMNGERRAALRDAFSKAGITIVQFVHEPLAALYAYFRSSGDQAAALREYDRKLILVVDWGGGTLDLTLCRLDDCRLTQLRNHGSEQVGGDEFDLVIRNEVLDAYCAEKGVEELLVHPDAKIRLLQESERAKMALSDGSSYLVYVPSFFRDGDEDLDYRLDRDSLDAVTRPIIEKGMRNIEELLEGARIGTEQVAMCLATGGMVNMPAVRARLHELFGPVRVKDTDRSSTLIAEGAAWVAHDQRKLHLAKTFELKLARGAYLPLIRAGAEVPAAGEVLRGDCHLYCADPRDGKAKLEFCVPVRPGPSPMLTDRRVPLALLALQVDAKADPFRERMELDYELDDDLIIHLSARSLNLQDWVEGRVHDLEFGLAFPGESGDGRIEFDDGGDHHESGDLVVRANVAAEADDGLVPGELLYTIKPSYFDRRRDPPQEQVDEHLYYQPCAGPGCGRASNDPACRCSQKSA